MTQDTTLKDFEMDGGIAGLARCLQAISCTVDPDMIEPGCDEPFIDVRLQYYDGLFRLHTGDSQYDPDHRGYWGSSSVGPDLTQGDVEEIASDLLDQVLEHQAP